MKKVVTLIPTLWIIASLAPGTCFLVPTGPRGSLYSAPGQAVGLAYKHSRVGTSHSKPTTRKAGAQAGRREVVRAMFSGIVEEMGLVSSLVKNDAVKLWDGTMGEGVELTVKAKKVLEGATDGCSISVNGVCLTVTEFDDQEFKVGLAPETLRRSNLEQLGAGDRVNLERALPVNGRNSGHFVQGHVDDVGTIISMESDENSIVVKVKAPEELMRYIVPKGFIAVDGTSLTVCEVDNRDCWFTIMLVAYTQEHIVLPSKSVGDKVNLEVDVLGKYVERSLASVLDRLSALEEWQEVSDRKLRATRASIPEDMGSSLERLEHLVKNRDLVLDVVENRLARLECESKNRGNEDTEAKDSESKVEP